jgi:hypothetical protein
MLQEALEWHDGNPMSLQNDPQFEGKVVQLTVKEDEYEGKTRLQVAFINHIDWTGAIPKADAAMAAKINNKYGAKFRAFFGGQQAAAKKPGKASSSPPRKAGSAPPRSKSGPPATKTATEEEAYEAFLELCDKDWTEEQIHGEWFGLLEKILGKADGDEITPEEWAQVVEEAPGLVLPI